MYKPAQRFYLLVYVPQKKVFEYFSKDLMRTLINAVIRSSLKVLISATLYLASMTCCVSDSWKLCIAMQPIRFELV